MISMDEYQKQGSATPDDVQEPGGGDLEKFVAVAAAAALAAAVMGAPPHRAALAVENTLGEQHFFGLPHLATYVLVACTATRISLSLGGSPEDASSTVRRAVMHAANQRRSSGAQVYDISDKSDSDGCDYCPELTGPHIDSPGDETRTYDVLGSWSSLNRQAPQFQFSWTNLNHDLEDVCEPTSLDELEEDEFAGSEFGKDVSVSAETCSQIDHTDTSTVGSIASSQEEGNASSDLDYPAEHLCSLNQMSTLVPPGEALHQGSNLRPWNGWPIQRSFASHANVNHGPDVSGEHDGSQWKQFDQFLSGMGMNNTVDIAGRVEDLDERFGPSAALQQSPEFSLETLLTALPHITGYDFEQDPVPLSLIQEFGSCITQRSRGAAVETLCIQLKHAFTRRGCNISRDVAEYLIRGNCDLFDAYAAMQHRPSKRKPGPAVKQPKPQPQPELFYHL